jgi:hypothetical protein
MMEDVQFRSNDMEDGHMKTGMLDADSIIPARSTTPRQSRRFTLIVAAVAIPVVLLSAIVATRNKRLRYDSSPYGCGSRVDHVDVVVNSGGEQENKTVSFPFSLLDCWDARVSEGPQILFLDDLYDTGSGLSLGGNSDGVGQGIATYANGTVVYAYTYVTTRVAAGEGGDQDSETNRQVRFSFRNGAGTYSVSQDTALLISTRGDGTEAEGTTPVLQVQQLDVDLSQTVVPGADRESIQEVVRALVQENADIAAFVANVLAQYSTDSNNNN